MTEKVGERDNNFLFDMIFISIKVLNKMRSPPRREKKVLFFPVLVVVVVMPFFGFE